jgi:hypothetical protein
MKNLPHKDALKFILAGKSMFAAINTKTGNQFTFRVNKSKDDKFYFVSGGSDKESLSYLGTINEYGYKHVKKSNIDKSAQVNKVFEYVFSKLLSNSLPEVIELFHYGHFCRLWYAHHV